MTNQSKELFCELENAGAEPDYALNGTFIGNSAFYLECLQNFSSDKNMQSLRDSLASGKAQDAIRAAHTLKGLADSLGLLPLMDCAFSVLDDLRKENRESCTADMAKLESMYSKFLSIINKYLESH